ncbi:MAG TPA: winged helix-turn-helix domain-containing protein [Streptosporangiaceae bacterium]|nr:winged helix-turn-helix domain-containing protein [Streptosporangiaceae bacterium]
MIMKGGIEAPGGRDDDLVYMRVVRDVEQQIASGILKPGARLRSERDLAHHYEVSYGSIRRAMKELRERGLIVTIQGRGTFIR